MSTLRLRHESLCCLVYLWGPCWPVTLTILMKSTVEGTSREPVNCVVFSLALYRLLSRSRSLSLVALLLLLSIFISLSLPISLSISLPIHLSISIPVSRCLAFSRSLVFTRSDSRTDTATPW